MASPESSAPFGRLIAAEAHQRRFYQAPHRAFVADGAAYNWSIHAGYVREFEPVVDQLRVLCYPYREKRRTNVVANESEVQTAA